MKNGIFTLFVGVSMATVNMQTDEHSFGNYGILPLSYECQHHKMRNFKFLETLRPKKPIIPGPLNIMIECPFQIIQSQPVFIVHRQTIKAAFPRAKFLCHISHALQFLLTYFCGIVTVNLY